MAGAAAGTKPGNGKDGRSVPAGVDGGVAPRGGPRSSAGSAARGAETPPVPGVSAPIRTALSGAERDVATPPCGLAPPPRAV